MDTKITRKINYPVKLSESEWRVVAAYGDYVGVSAAAVIRSLVHQLGLQTTLLTEEQVQELERTSPSFIRGELKGA